MPIFARPPLGSLGYGRRMHEFGHEGLVFDVTDAGPRDGDVALLLHGWPQDRSAWTEVADRLVTAGMRVVAFDQRGCSPRARPSGRAAYRMSRLVSDVVAAADAAGAQQVHLVGHDWGGAVAWAVAERHPERVAALTVLSTPHHRAFAAALRHPDQASRSWYMAAFQLPWLPEVVLRPTLPTVLRRSGLPEEAVRRYAARLREPGGASGGLAWYRALSSRPADPLQPKGPRSIAHPQRIEVPTTYLWGRHDPALGRRAAEATRRWVGEDYRFVELDAGHWLPETRPDDVAAAVLSRWNERRAHEG